MLTGVVSIRVPPVSSASPMRAACPDLAGPVTPSDIAQAEAGWSTLKIELPPLRETFASLEKARLEVAYYLDT